MATTPVSGIYEIVNLENGKRYIGSAVSIPNRLSGHRSQLRAGKHRNPKLQRSWTKYGADKFVFRTILICAPANLICYEQILLDKFGPQLNLSPTAGSTLGVVLSDDRRQKISAKLKGRKRDRDAVERSAAKRRGVKLSPEHRQTLFGNKHALGLKHTDEWKTANSLRNKGKRRPKSPEYRAKISAALKGISHSAERRAKQVAGQRGKKRGPYKLDPAKAEQRRLAGKRLAATVNRKRWSWDGDDQPSLFDP